MVQKCFWLLLFGAALTAGCRTTRVSRAQQANFKYSYCVPTIPDKSPVWIDTGLVSLPPGRLSPHDSLLGSVLGISSWLGGLLTLPADSLHELRRLSLKQKIGQRILVAQTELDAVVAELDCEGERASLAATYLDNFNSRHNRHLTIASVVVGALTTAATALISSHDGQAAVGIPGGVASAALALSTINPKGRKIAFYHDRNLLTSVWQQTPASDDYPPFVWKMLHVPQFSNSGTVTLAESIRTRWLGFEFDARSDKDKEALLFGKGGYYHSDELHIRAAMLNQMKSTIRSIDQDLASLVAVIEALQ